MDPDDELAKVIAETQKLQPWLEPVVPTNADERKDAVVAARYERRNHARKLEPHERSVCPVVGCGRRKQRTSLTCYKHRRGPTAATNPFERG